MHDQMIWVTLTGSVNLSSYVNYVGVSLSSEWWLKDMDQSIIRCQPSPLKPSCSAPFSIATLRGILVPLFHTAVVNYTMSDSKIASHTSHLRRSTFKGGAAAPGATLARQTRCDSSFATALFWLRHGANAPPVLAALGVSSSSKVCYHVLAGGKESGVGWWDTGETWGGDVQRPFGAQSSGRRWATFQFKAVERGWELKGGALMSAESRRFWCATRQNEWALAGRQSACMWV